VKRITFAVIFLLIASCCYADLTLDCADNASLMSFVQTVRTRNISGERLVIADQPLCAREMIAMKVDEKGNLIRPAILGCFQFRNDTVSIFIGDRVITGKTAFEGARLTITNITDTGVNP
jgi:hypothetical protein